MVFLTITGVLSSIVDKDDLSKFSWEPLEVLSWRPDLLTQQSYDHRSSHNTIYLYLKQ